MIDNSCTKLVENCCSFKEKISVLFSLNLSWKENEPKETRIECDSFVLCLDILGDNILVGLNNGCMQGIVICNMGYNLQRNTDIYSCLINVIFL